MMDRSDLLMKRTNLMMEKPDLLMNDQIYILNCRIFKTYRIYRLTELKIIWILSFKVGKCLMVSLFVGNMVYLHLNPNKIHTKIAAPSSSSSIINGEIVRVLCVFGRERKREFREINCQKKRVSLRVTRRREKANNEYPNYPCYITIAPLNFNIVVNKPPNHF